MRDRAGGSSVPPLTVALGVVLATLASGAASAQTETGTRPLEIADYAQWRTISGSQISDDGREGVILGTAARSKPEASAAPAPSGRILRT